MIVVNPRIASAIRESSLANESLDRRDQTVIDCRASQPVESAIGYTTGFVDWLQAQVDVTTERIDRAQLVEKKLREKAVLEAKLCWDTNRELETELLGAKLDLDPTEVVAGLRRTPHGCEWLLKRWSFLIFAAETEGSWTIEQALMASRMLGMPVEFENEANPLEMILLDGRPLKTSADLAALARREVKQLLTQRDVVRPLDDAAKLRAQQDDLPTDPRQKEQRTQTSHERSLYHRLRWLIRQIEESSETLTALIVPTTQASGPAEVSEAQDENKESVNEPKVASADVNQTTRPFDRLANKLQKAAARREAKDRKLERRRG